MARPTGDVTAAVPVSSRRSRLISTRYPDDDSGLLHHREQTRLRPWQALFFAPLSGIQTSTGLETHEHPLPTLLGRGYHSCHPQSASGHRSASMPPSRRPPCCRTP